MTPPGRTGTYAAWRASERFGICPPGIKKDWNSMEMPQHAMLLAYDEIRQEEELKMAASLAGIKVE